MKNSSNLENNALFRYHDLVENPIRVVGEEDEMHCIMVLKTRVKNHRGIFQNFIRF